MQDFLASLLLTVKLEELAELSLKILGKFHLFEEIVTASKVRKCLELALVILLFRGFHLLVHIVQIFFLLLLFLFYSCVDFQFL